MIHQRRARETRVAERLGAQRRNDSRDYLCAIYVHKILVYKILESFYKPETQDRGLRWKQGLIVPILKSGINAHEIIIPAFPASLLPAFREPCADDF